LKGERIDFLTSTMVLNVNGTSGQSVIMTGTGSDGPFEIAGSYSYLLVSNGRLLNTGEIGLEPAGVELTPTGHVKVNKHLQTTSPGIFEVGDCANSPHFTYIGFDDFRVLRDFVLNKQPLHSTVNRQVPLTFTQTPGLQI
jgi:pyruvate/2-oxoglutarate dehydrogenase complex dihydrolipoamide dehydrogenase (E3) component